MIIFICKFCLMLSFLYLPNYRGFLSLIKLFFAFSFNYLAVEVVILNILPACHVSHQFQKNVSLQTWKVTVSNYPLKNRLIMRYEKIVFIIIFNVSFEYNIVRITLLSQLDKAFLREFFPPTQDWLSLTK